MLSWFLLWLILVKYNSNKILYYLKKENDREKVISNPAITCFKYCIKKLSSLSLTWRDSRTNKINCTLYLIWTDNR